MEHYSTYKKTKNDVIHLWYVDLYGEVFINNIDKSRKKIRIDEITIATKDLQTATSFARAKWNLKCDNISIQEIYCFRADETEFTITGYVITQGYGDLENLKGKGRFISYQELDDEFKKFKVTIDFKESFYSLLEYLDKTYGYKELPGMDRYRSSKAVVI